MTQNYQTPFFYFDRITHTFEGKNSFRATVLVLAYIAVNVIKHSCESMLIIVKQVTDS